MRNPNPMYLALDLFHVTIRPDLIIRAATRAAPESSPSVTRTIRIVTADISITE